MFSKLLGRKVKILYNGELKAFIIKQYNFTQFVGFLQDNLEIPRTTQYELRYKDNFGGAFTVSSDSEFVSSIDKGIIKYELVPKEQKQKISVIERMSKLETSQPLEDKHETKDPAKDLPSIKFHLNPSLLGKLFEMFMTVDACALEVKEIIEQNRGCVLDGKHTIGDYAEALTNIEKTMKDALEENIFLLDLDEYEIDDNPFNSGKA
eukprot:TRINITY_DN2637_c0_g3_i1.p1 TRINITY_DN2637_c0_g3~~TRINITY_DN2637_c0_g3_i1.p1  ORF type:complete len:214 (+),score=60.23 TRINITY_DN2637_c0_g3_i1:23-643(+)